MRYVVAILACLFLFAACSQQRESPEPVLELVPFPTVTVIKSVTVPCPAPPSILPTVTPTRPAPSDGRPAYVLGAGTVRLSVAHSKDEAKEQKRKLDKLLKGTDWAFQVWGTRSGKDKRVKARVHAVEVDPVAGEALCAWLMAKGWKPGAVPCEMK